jgi:hypothetical protein
MRWLWKFVALRTAFSVDIPDNPISVVAGLAAQVRSRQWWWSLASPPAGEYLAGDVSAREFAVSCIRCSHGSGKSQVRWVEASGTLNGDANRTTVTVVVRHGFARLSVNFLLITCTVATLLGWPLLMLQGELGSVLAAGCGAPALVLPALWLFFNWSSWQEVQEGRKQITRALQQLCG